MRGAVEEAQHVGAAEAGDEMVDEGGGLALGLAAAVDEHLAGAEHLGARHGEAHQVEAEAGIGRIIEQVHPLGEEA